MKSEQIENGRVSFDAIFDVCFTKSVIRIEWYWHGFCKNEYILFAQTEIVPFFPS